MQKEQIEWHFFFFFWSTCEVIAPRHIDLLAPRGDTARALGPARNAGRGARRGAAAARRRRRARPRRRRRPRRRLRARRFRRAPPRALARLGAARPRRRRRRPAPPPAAARRCLPPPLRAALGGGGAAAAARAPPRGSAPRRPKSNGAAAPALPNSLSISRSHARAAGASPLHPHSSPPPPPPFFPACRTDACAPYISATCSGEVESSGPLSSRTRTRRGKRIEMPLASSTRPAAAG